MNAKQELQTLQHSAETLNEARIIVVEFLDAIEVEKRLSVISATKLLQRALTLYERSIRFLSGATALSILGDYYSEISNSAVKEKDHVTAMFKAVLKQDVATFDKHYQAYIKSLL